MLNISVNEERYKGESSNQDIIGPPCDAIPDISENINNEKGSEELCDMLKMLSHDIRSPLVTIGATLKLLKKGIYGTFDQGVNKELEKLIRLVIQATGVMEDLMGMAFSYGNIENEHCEILDIREDIFYPVIIELKKILEEREVILFNEEFNYKKEERALTFGNRFLLKSVFRNLINNAVRYGGKGCKLSCSIVQKSCLNVIAIFNTGNPISESDQIKLFLKNTKIEKTIDNSGMGMGLYLISEIIRKNKGKIWYEPCQKGSKFIFTLPLVE